MIRWLNKKQPWAVFFIRIALGAAMAYSGWQKVVPQTGLFHGHLTEPINHFATFVATLGLPRWLAYVSAATELVGGIWLFVGLFTRFCAFMIAINMLVALITVNLKHGFAGSEFVLLLIATAILLLTAGSGTLSIDRRLGIS